MLQFRAHWQGQETRDQFQADSARCMRLVKQFTSLFLIARVLNADFANITRLPPHDSLRVWLDRYLMDGIAVGEFRVVQSEVLRDVLLLTNKELSVEDRHQLLLTLVRKVNTMALRATWEVTTAAPERLWFTFPPCSNLSERQVHSLRAFYSGLLVQGPAWGLKNVSQDVRVVQRKNTASFCLSRGRVDLHGSSWIVKRSFNASTDFREDIYSSLITSLEDGSFSLLRRCPYCSLFFIREDGKQKFCSKQCREEHFNEDAKNRVKKHRERQARRHSQETSEIYLKRLIHAESSDRDGKLLSIYQKLGGAQEGRRFIRKLKGKSWRELTPDIQKKITMMAHDHPQI